MKYPITAIFILILLGSLSGQDVDIEGSLSVQKMDTVLKTGNTVVQLDGGLLQVRRIAVGDFVYGGIVIWVDDLGEHGIVVDTAILSFNVPWSNGTLKDVNSKGNGIYSGQDNTLISFLQQINDNPAEEFASQLSLNLERSGYGDWYLPSIQELEIMYTLKDEIDAAILKVGGDLFTNCFYWSSTELTSDFAWTVNFSTGQSSGTNKTLGVCARAVRRF